ncbi:MAG: DUF86 domain-containing protein [Firmicutes bacterium]|nr:DUF86 domain-containing protein [Bacillota bacterium]MCL5040278.1 DUF86 domain-containing protein [Bacillota bacterium]
MMNLDLIRDRVDLIHKSIARLEKLAALGEEEFQANADNYAIAEHHLRRALESVFDIGRHIMAKKGLGHPVDYRSILATLGQQGILPPPFTERIRNMAGYRNRLVHGYAEVTPQELHILIKTRLEDFQEFCRYILKYIESQF